jgi:polyvinyl alcohol dehydrogenase (cytochrome)
MATLVVGAAALVSVPGAAAAATSTSTDTSTTVANVSTGDWPSAGQNAGDTHYSSAESPIGPGDVARLSPKWTFTTGGDVSATPTVVGGVVYEVDWAGDLYAINATSGKAIWTRSIATYTGVQNDVSRTSPAYWQGELVLGDGTGISPTLDGAYVTGVNAGNGNARWVTQVDSNPAAIVTGAPIVYDGVAYVGVSSKSEGLTTAPTFRGSLVALNASTGKILWRTFMVPTGYTGAAVWGSTPVVDPERGLVYIGTGNNYSSPAGVCTSPADTNCTPQSTADHEDSIVALRMATGAIAWATPTLTADTWTLAQQFGPDFDFGSAPDLYTTVIDGRPTDLLGIGQKSGVYWALNPDTGAIVWATAVGPGSELGGIEWGSVADGRQIYVANTNFGHIATTLKSFNGQTSTTTGGFWAALNAATGKITWETAVPAADQTQTPYAMLSGANGVLYGGTLNTAGQDMYALNMTTGAILWSFGGHGAAVGGAAIVDGSVYWGSGYPSEDLFFPVVGDNNKLYAFSLY